MKETTGNNEINKDEMRRLFSSTLDQVINDINVRFSHQNTKLYATVSALQSENINFLDVKMVEPLLDLLYRASLEADFDVAQTYVAIFYNDAKTYPTTTKFLSEHCKTLMAMTTVHLARKLRVTFEASTAKRENFFLF